MGINCLFFINPCTLPLILILLNSNLSIRKEINLSTYFNLMVEEKFLSLFWLLFKFIFLISQQLPFHVGNIVTLIGFTYTHCNSFIHVFIVSHVNISIFVWLIVKVKKTILSSKSLTLSLSFYFSFISLCLIHNSRQ